MRRLALALVLFGCAGPEGEPVPLPAPDAAHYEAHVQVVVGYGCGSLDCHGDEGRPLRIYGRDGLRLDAALRGQPLSAEEAAQNALAFAGVAPGLGLEDHVGLTKPLAEGMGGLPHVGGDIWPNREDAAYVCVRDWLAGEHVEAELCARASEAIDPR